MSNKYNVQILVDGKPIKEYTKDSKVFIESKSGTEYSIRLKNNTSSRSMAIISVDGINVITGEVATPDSTGYVLNAFSSMEIKGYRQDTEGGAKFKFTEKESGYAKEIDGTGINSGVIGVLFIKEESSSVLHQWKPAKWIPSANPNWPNRPFWMVNDALYRSSVISGSDMNNELKSCDTSFRSACKGPGVSTREVDHSCYTSSVNDTHLSAPAFDQSTTWGSEYKESVVYVDFTSSSERETHNIYYASRDALKSMKVISDTPPQVSFPQSFPGFAKPPSGWKS